MLAEFIVRFLPIVLLGIIGFSVLPKNRLISFPSYIVIVVCVVFVVAIATLPEDISIDKPRYAALFHYGYRWGWRNDYNDYGWMTYVVVCARLFNDNVFFFFLLTAIGYVFSYYCLSKHFFGQYSFYFVVMAMGCLGFASYATNTIRAGFAIAFLLFGLAVGKKTWTLLLMVLGVLIHRSMIIPVIGYYLSLWMKHNWMFYLIWFSCMILAIGNMDLGPIFESFGFVDNRIEGYTQSIGNQFSSYKKGFRWDFLIYSITPIVISLYNNRKKIEDEIYNRMINMYLFSNAVWLLAIRIAYSDRLAYLSWFLIPIITLYPVIKYQDRYRNPNVLVFVIMSVFLCLNILLMLI